MAIKEVTIIPKPNTKQKSDRPTGYYHDLIREDLKNAYKLKIKQFEFVGYEAKPDYIAQTARSEAYDVCRELIYMPAKKYVIRKLKDEFDERMIRCIIPGRYSPNSIIKIRGVTLEDGVKHIYCEIDYKEARKFKKVLLQDTIERTNARISREKKY